MRVGFLFCSTTHNTKAEAIRWERSRALIVEEDGPTAIEYGLIAALIAVAIIAALILLGGALSNIFGYMGNTVNNAAE